MTDPLVSLAAFVADRPFFLASLLGPFAHSERLDDISLARRLGCVVEQLPMLRLCRAPRSDPAGFREDMAAIAGHFRLDEMALREAVKCGWAIRQLREAIPPRAGVLMAARDREPKEEAP
jgi:hypothetical protein